MISSCTHTGNQGADSRVAALDSLFEDRYSTPDGMPAPGAAVLIAEGDSVIFERYYGVAQAIDSIMGVN